MKKSRVIGVTILSIGMIALSFPVFANQQEDPQDSQTTVAGQPNTPVLFPVPSSGYSTWNAMGEIDRLQENVERFLRNLQGDQLASFPKGQRGTFGGITYSPDVDLYESKEDYQIELDLPGMEKKDIDVEVQENVLTISGERKREEVREGQKDGFGYYYQGRSFGTFAHSMELPEDANKDKIDAKYDKGVLTLTIEKLDSIPVEPAKKINIQ